MNDNSQSQFPVDTPQKSQDKILECFWDKI